MRTAIQRYGGCLSELPARQRRVLRMRAGIGPGEPATRGQVARRLDLPVSRVRRAERRGLRALAREARDGCSAAATVGAGTGADIGSGAVLTVPDGAGADGGTLLASDDGEAAAPGAAQGEGDGSATNGGGSSDGNGSGANGTTDAEGGFGEVKGITATRPPSPAAPLDLTLPLLLILLLASAVAGGWQIRRSRGGTAG